MASVLALTPQIPYPPRQGTALRNWGIVKGVGTRHELSLLSFAAPDQPTGREEIQPPLSKVLARFEAHPQPTRSTGERLRDLLGTSAPDLARRLVSSGFERSLRDWLTEFHFDWLIVEGLELAPYIDIARRVAPALNVVFDDHNCEYLLQQRTARTDWRRPRRWLGAAYSEVQWRRLRRYEAEICRQADLVIAVSQDDADALRTLAPSVDPMVMPNGLHIDEYAGFEAQALLAKPAFVFTGTMDFRPNVDGVLWFARQVWPTVREALPEASFTIVGRNPHARLTPLADEPGIEVIGSVPDTRPYIRAATVYVVPLQVGGGTRLKLLESSAMGKAIVSTTLGAEGFDQADLAMLLADSPEAFAEACIDLAQHPQSRVAWEQRAQSFARRYDWDVLLPTLLRHLEV
jgi:glycosyltransferase involved in cell wall biosynthesis